MPLLLRLAGVAALLAPRTVLVSVAWLLAPVGRRNVRTLLGSGTSIGHRQYLLSRRSAGWTIRGARLRYSPSGGLSRAHLLGRLFEEHFDNPLLKFLECFNRRRERAAQGPQVR